jgi:predicted nucleotidyltransferase
MTGRPIPELAAAARDVMDVLDKAGLSGCLIGGLVVQRWGQPRATTDVDFSVLAPYGDEHPVLDVLLQHFAPRRSDARAFALANRVLLLITSSGVSVDVGLAAFEFEFEALERASLWEAIPGVQLRTCAAEHLIVYKLVAARLHDLADVEGIVRRQAGRLDVECVRRWGRVFAELKDDPDLLRPFEETMRKLTL